jgi:hypothetical protein
MIFFMTRMERLALWSDRVTNYRNSGIGLRNWCDQQQVNIHSMKYWTQKLRHHHLGQSHTAQSDNSALQWYPLNFSTPPVAPALQIRIGEASVEVSHGFDPELLRDVVCVLARC